MKVRNFFVAHKNIVLIFLLIAVPAAIYANSLKNSFVWDDVYLIVKNPFIKNCNFVSKIFTSDLFHTSSGKRAVVYYRPLQSLSLMFDYRLWHLNPIGYRITNILFHILNAILVFLLVNSIVENRKISLITSLLFVVHPVHVEAVTYISGRADPMAGFFLLSAFILFIRYTSYPGLKRSFFYLGSIALFILALFSKETAIIFPLILISYDFAFPDRTAQINFRDKIRYRHLSFLIVTVGYGLFRILVLNLNGQIATAMRTGFIPRVLTSCKVIVQYIGLFFIPLGLHMERKVPLIMSPAEPTFLSSLFLLCIIAVVVFISYRYFRPAFFGLAWFFLMLLPVSSIIVPLKARMAEHWLYLPSIGLFMAISIGLFRIVRLTRLNVRGPITRSFKNIMIAFFVSIFIFYSFLTMKQNTYWKDELTFYKRTLQFNPDSDYVHINLGILYLKQGLKQKAKDEFEHAVKLNPNSFVAHKCLGNVYFKENLLDKAMDKYRKSLELDPEYSGALVNMGAIFYEMGLYDEAIKEFEKAIQINPYDEEPHSNLGVIYLEKGWDKKALIEFKKTLRLNPDNINVHKILVDYYEKMGILPELIEEYKKVVELDPGDIEIRNKLAIAYDKKGMHRKALNEFKKALRKDPHSAETHNNLGVFYAKLQQFQKAEKEWREALKIDPNYIDAQRNLTDLKRLGY